MVMESAGDGGSAGGAAPAAEHPRESQTDVVLNGIKQMITTGELTAGARLPVEKDLAARLGVSRGSLREGVRALCIMGVLETRQGDGTYVTSLDSSLLLAPMSFMVDLQGPKHRADVHAVRRILESESAARAAVRIDEAALEEARRILDGVEPLVGAEHRPTDHHEAFVEADIHFHGVIARNSGNSTLAALIEALASRTARARVWMGLHSEGQIARAHREHRAIWEALRQHDPDRARLQMAYHLLTVEDFVHSHPTAPVD
ncbi:MAG TPA: FadR/GntR family transcriptional regulator [Microlunatus sp.]|nr:FadR/GntR family transcriptional regulator [Microlunatus sp.]